MKNHPFIALLAASGVLTLVALGYLVATQDPRNEEALMALANNVLDAAEAKNEALSSDARRVSGDGFSLMLPAVWSAKALDDEFIPGQRLLMTLRNVPKAGMFDGPETVTIDILYQSKTSGFTYDQTVEDFSINEDEVNAWVIAWGGAVAREDYTVEQSALDLDGVLGTRSFLECRKGCFPDESFPTEFVELVYFLDIGDRVYVMKAKTYFSQQSDALIQQAEQVMRSFQVE